MESTFTNDNEFYFPAEWEKQQAVWLGYDEWGTGAREKQEMVLQLAKVLYPFVNVNIVVSNDKRKNYIKSILSDNEVNLSKIDFFLHPYPYFWMRDPGPLFLKNNKGQKQILSFNWNFYGYHEVFDGITEYSDYPQSTKQVGQYGKFFSDSLNIQHISSTLIAEGGGLEVNGAGVLMTVKETALNRNPSKSLKDIEIELLAKMGQKKIIWLAKSPVEDLLSRSPQVSNYHGGGANGHIDEFCRFANATTILLEEIADREKHLNPINELDYQILEENHKILRSSSDLNDHPFEIIRIPKPDIDELKIEVELSGDSAYEYYKEFGFNREQSIFKLRASSYLNYFITNNCVLIPAYYKRGMSNSLKEKDQYVREIFCKLYPNREVVQLDASDINKYGGGIHCATQQEPAIK